MYVRNSGAIVWYTKNVSLIKMLFTCDLFHKNIYCYNKYNSIPLYTYMRMYMYIRFNVYEKNVGSF